MLQGAAWARYSRGGIFVNTRWVCFMYPGRSVLSGCPSVSSKLQNLPLKNSVPSPASPTQSCLSKQDCDWMIFLTCLSKGPWHIEGRKKKRER